MSHAFLEGTIPPGPKPRHKTFSLWIPVLKTLDYILAILGFFGGRDMPTWKTQWSVKVSVNISKLGEKGHQYGCISGEEHSNKIVSFTLKSTKYRRTVSAVNYTACRNVWPIVACFLRHQHYNHSQEVQFNDLNYLKSCSDASMMMKTNSFKLLAPEVMRHFSVVYVWPVNSYLLVILYHTSIAFFF